MPLKNLIPAQAQRIIKTPKTPILTSFFILFNSYTFYSVGANWERYLLSSPKSLTLFYHQRSVPQRHP